MLVLAGSQVTTIHCYAAKSLKLWAHCKGAKVLRAIRGVRGARRLRKRALRRAAGEGDALVRAAVVVHGACQDGAARRPRREARHGCQIRPRQDHDHNAVGACIAICRRVERLAVALRAQTSSARSAHAAELMHMLEAPPEMLRDETQTIRTACRLEPCRSKAESGPLARAC